MFDDVCIGNNILIEKVDSWHYLGVDGGYDSTEKARVSCV